MLFDVDVPWRWRNADVPRDANPPERARTKPFVHAVLRLHTLRSTLTGAQESAIEIPVVDRNVALEIERRHVPEDGRHRSSTHRRAHGHVLPATISTPEIVAAKFIARDAY